MKLKNVSDELIDGVIRIYKTPENLFASNDLDIVLDGEGVVGFGDLYMGRIVDNPIDSSVVCAMCLVVKLLADAFGQSAVIIADSTCNGSDMCTSCVCYLGEKLKYQYFSSGEKADLFNTTDIGNIAKWINAGNFFLTDTETSLLTLFDLKLARKIKKGQIC